MVSTKPSAFHFVVSDNLQKPDPELRKFIRSHVMVGKNKGKARPRRKKGPKDAQDQRLSSSDESPGRSSPSSEDTLSVSSDLAILTASHRGISAPAPQKFGSTLSTIRFPDSVEPRSVDVVLKLSSIATKIMFPLEKCLLFEGRAKEWVAPLVHDPAYLHAMIFTAQCYFDVILPRKFDSSDRRTMPYYPHYIRTLKLLRERLSNEKDQARLSNATAAAIMGLAGHAHLMGDFKTARHHMEGLSKIISLRGGVASFSDNVKLLVEIFSCDIAMTLDRGTNPVFYNDPSSPFLPCPDLQSLFQSRPLKGGFSKYSPSLCIDGADDTLAEVWTVMSTFCSVINFAVDSSQLISMSTFLETMASTMYRLISRRFEAGSRDEALRLGMLAFASCVFLPWKRFGVTYRDLTATYRACLVRSSSSVISPQLLVWLLMVGAVAVFDPTDEAWLQSMLVRNMGLGGIGSWNELQELLRSFMWIGLVHDQPAKAVYESGIRLSGWSIDST